MMEVIRRRNVGVCKLLLGHGFDPNTCYSLHDADNVTAIDLAALWDGWMNGVLGHFYALSMLNWAGDNLGRTLWGNIHK